MEVRLLVALATAEDEAIRNLAAVSQASVPVAPRAQHVLTSYERAQVADAAAGGRAAEERPEQSSGGREARPQDDAEGEAVAARADGVPESESVNVWPDESAEAAFMAEARERGEPAKASRAAVEEIEEREDAKALPKLSDLVEKIPVETRELLDELFRVKFVAVRKVRKADLKE